MKNIENLEPIIKVLSLIVSLFIAFVTKVDFSKLLFLRDVRKKDLLKIKVETFTLLKEKIEDKAVIENLNTDFNHQILCVIFNIKPQDICPSKRKNMSRIFDNKIKQLDSHTIIQFMSYHYDLIYSNDPGDSIYFKTKSDYVGLILFTIMSVVFVLFISHAFMKMISPIDNLKYSLVLILLSVVALIISNERRRLNKSIKDKTEFNIFINKISE
jgi:hypothetical protein